MRVHHWCSTRNLFRFAAGSFEYLMKLLVKLLVTIADQDRRLIHPLFSRFMQKHLGLMGHPFTVRMDGARARDNPP